MSSFQVLMYVLRKDIFDINIDYFQYNDNIIINNVLYFHFLIVRLIYKILNISYRMSTRREVIILTACR